MAVGAKRLSLRVFLGIVGLLLGFCQIYTGFLSLVTSKGVISIRYWPLIEVGSFVLFCGVTYLYKRTTIRGEGLTPFVGLLIILQGFLMFGGLIFVLGMIGYRRYLIPALLATIMAAVVYVVTLGYILFGKIF